MKKWLITGASSGFGRLLAERVATDGDQVIAVARREDRLRELAADHDSVTPLAVDLTASDGEQRIATAIDAAGGLDVLVNDAGYGLFAPVEQTPDSEARAVFARSHWSGSDDRGAGDYVHGFRGDLPSRATR
jgi:NAD(P)-dependent dehydrogenase (short-subunit alcohol dehydrogenase family)